MELISNIATLRRIAPAAMTDIGIVTVDFLDAVAEHGFHPVLAAQGTSHQDSIATRTTGRHIVIAASGQLCVALLNSHTKDRPVYAGIGLYDSRRHLWLIGHHVVLHRSRGFEAKLNDLLGAEPALRSIREKMASTVVSRPIHLAALIDQVTKTAHLDNAYQADPADLMEKVRKRLGQSALTIAFTLQEEIMAGGLKTKNGLRRTKPLKRPDALMHLSSAVFSAVCAMNNADGHALRPFRGRH